MSDPSAVPPTATPQMQPMPGAAPPLGLEASPLPGYGVQLGRTSSGIRGTTAPPWDEVSGAMSHQHNTMTEFLRRMFDTLCQQQQALEDLRRVSSNNNAKLENFHAEMHEHFGQINARLEAVDQRFEDMHERQTQLQHENEAAHSEMCDRLRELESAIGLERAARERLGHGLETLEGSVRQEWDQNMSEKRTIRETVDELSEQHNKLVIGVMRERCGRMRMTAWALNDLNLKGRIWRYFHKWVTWRNLTGDERCAAEGKEMRCMQLLTVTKKGLLRSYFQRLQHFLKWAHRQRFLADRYRRALRKLVYIDGKSTLARYWAKFMGFLAEIEREREERQRINEQTADTLADISKKALTNRWLQKWIRFRAARAEWKRKHSITESMEDLSINTVLKRHYDKLLRLVKWRHYRRKRASVAVVLEQDSNKRTLQVYLDKLAAHAQKVRRVLERTAVARALMTKNTQLLRREFWHKWARHTNDLSRQRERAEFEARLMEVGCRMDNLGTQVDVGLKTLSNTNSVLNRLVDRLIAVDEQLDTLSKEKVGKRELRFITGTEGEEPVSPKRHADPRSPSPSKRGQREQGSPRGKGAARSAGLLSSESYIQPDSRQEELEREHELERQAQERREREMEQEGQRLENLVRSLEEWGDPAAAGAGAGVAAPTPPPTLHRGGIQRPLTTPAAAPCGMPPAGGVGFSPSSAADSQEYAYHYTSEFQREYQRQIQLMNAMRPPGVRNP